MDLRARGRCRAILSASGCALFVLAQAVTAGCGGSTNFPPPTVIVDGGADSRRNPTDSGMGGSTAPPPVGPGSQTLVTGDARLVGSGPDSCTNQDPATGDRWCAFSLPSTFLGGTDLWVINVSKALGGKTIQCNAGDLDCLLLTSTLSAGDLTIHSFFGDTLIYYADSGANSGPVYGWRPGMTAGRKLTAATGLQCFGHPKTDAVLCFDNLDTTTSPGDTLADVLTGKLSVGGTATLPKVATLLVTAGTDAAGVRKYQVGLSSAGDYVAWSTRSTAGALETLSVQKLNDDSTRVVVAEDVARWAFSRDNAKWYWLKSFNYSTNGNPIGTLQMANFPTDTGGAAPAATTLRANVASFGTAGDKGLVYFGPLTAGGLGDLGLIADRDSATVVKTVDRSLRVLDLSRDGRTLIYSKSVSADGSNFDLYVGGLDLATPCQLTGTANSPPPFATLSDSAATAFWSYGDAVTGEFVGEYTTLATCHTAKFSTNLWFWNSVKDQGVVYGDTIAGTSLADLTLTLRYAEFTGTSLPSSGTVVQERANQMFSVLLPAVSAVVYTVNTGGATDGLYVKAGLPFASTP